MSTIRFDADVYCSFCMKSQRDVEVMVAGPALVFICDECIIGCAATADAKRAELQQAADIERCAPCAPSPLTIGMAFAAHILGDYDHG